MGEQATLEFDKSFGDVLLHKLKNLKKSFLSHLIIYIKLAYTQIWCQSVIWANDLL